MRTMRVWRGVNWLLRSYVLLLVRFLNGRGGADLRYVAFVDG